MEKWKLATILGLLLCFIGFGAWQQNGGNALPIAPPASNGTAAPIVDKIAQLYNGKTLPTWNFKQWMNTKTPVTNADLAGKTTLVEVFRIKCSHCQDAAPFMAAIQRRYGARGLKMIGIQSPIDFDNPENLENSWTDVQSWVKERGLKYPIAFDPKSSYFQGTIFKTLLKGDREGLYYPLMIIVGPDQKNAYSSSGHTTEKAINLAVELEKRFPTSKDAAQSAADLLKWLRANLPELELDATLSKAISDNLAQRLGARKK